MCNQDGVLHDVVSESAPRVLSTTVSLIKALAPVEDVILITTPIMFEKNYPELVDPVGILKVRNHRSQRHCTTAHTHMILFSCDCMRNNARYI